MAIHVPGSGSDTRKAWSSEIAPGPVRDPDELGQGGADPPGARRPDMHLGEPATKAGDPGPPNQPNSSSAP